MANEYQNQDDPFNRLSDSDKQWVIAAAEAETKMIKHLIAWIDAPDPTEQALAIAEKADNPNKGIINRFFRRNTVSNSWSDPEAQKFMSWFGVTPEEFEKYSDSDKQAFNIHKLAHYHTFNCYFTDDLNFILNPKNWKSIHPKWSFESKPSDNLKGIGADDVVSKVIDMVNQLIACDGNKLRRFQEKIQHISEKFNSVTINIDNNGRDYYLQMFESAAEYVSSAKRAYHNMEQAFNGDLGKENAIFQTPQWKELWKYVKNRDYDDTPECKESLKNFISDFTDESLHYASLEQLQKLQKIPAIVADWSDEQREIVELISNRVRKFPTIVDGSTLQSINGQHDSDDSEYEFVKLTSESDQEDSGPESSHASIKSFISWLFFKSLIDFVNKFLHKGEVRQCPRAKPV